MSNDVALFIHRALINSGKRSELIQKYSGTKSNWQSTSGVLITCSDSELLLAILKEAKINSSALSDTVFDIKSLNQDGIGFNKIIY